MPSTEPHRTSSLAGNAPVVSVGLPVYNGEPYLIQAIESVLSQTFADFELIICDNASTDGTESICRGYAARDTRIRYVRNPENIGGGRNHNLVFTLARGRFFRWMGSDDYLAAESLAQTVPVLEAEADVVLCHTGIMIIDGDSRHIRPLSQVDRSQHSAAQRFGDIIDLGHKCEEIYGLWRSSALAQTSLHQNYTDSDRSLIAHLSLLGQFRLLSSVLYFQRVHAGMSTQVYPDWRSRMVWYGAEYADRITLPFWSQLRHYLRIIRTAPVDRRTKLRCYRAMAIWPTRYRRWRLLIQDVRLALLTLRRRRLRPAAMPRR